jgi:hypothetical protein
VWVFQRCALIVDGQAKKEFDTRDRALKVARELKGRFPHLPVRVFDAETKQSETIEFGTAYCADTCGFRASFRSTAQKPFILSAKAANLFENRSVHSGL